LVLSEIGINPGYPASIQKSDYKPAISCLPETFVFLEDNFVLDSRFWICF